MIDEVVKSEIKETVKSQGWRHIEKIMDDKINLSVEKLQTVEPSNIVEITQLQTTIKTFKYLRNEIKRTVG